MSLLDLPSAIFVLVPVLGAFIASQFTQQGIKLANSIILQTGLVGTLIGLITMLGNMSDPGEIGPGLSIASLTILYALIASSVFTLASLKTSSESPELRPSFSIIAIILWIAITFWAVAFGSGILAFINIPSLLFVALSILIIATFGKANFKSNHIDYRFKDVPALIAGSLRLCGEYLPYAGLIGSSIGISSMIIDLGDSTAIAPALAFSFLTLCYTNWISVAIKLGLSKNAREYKSSSWQYLGFAIFSLVLSISLLVATLLRME